jgi:hypothetical protein
MSETRFDRKSRPDLSGLCTTCNHTGTCMYLLRRNPPVWRCEEFDDKSPARVTLTLTKGTLERGATHIAGLCANCDELPTCALPRAGTGVWHCEEYR